MDTGHLLAAGVTSGVRLMATAVLTMRKYVQLPVRGGVVEGHHLVVAVVTIVGTMEIVAMI